MYAPNSEASDFIEKNPTQELKTQININSLVVGGFSASFSPVVRSSGQKLHKENHD